MGDALISLLILCLVLAIVVAVILYAVDLLPVENQLKRLIHILVILIAVLIILFRALPLLGVAI